MTKEKKDELKARVRKCKEIIRRRKDFSKEHFFDTQFGCLFHSEHNRINNLWSEKITDEMFTAAIENYCGLSKHYIKIPISDWDRFHKFVDWYVDHCGGKPLSPEQIEAVYPKLLKNKRL